ncbi:MAG: hypothetical protein B6U94_01455 [Thermofilum sp. ex4484_79]|nr:MAG: hypothetical protein B6U94_01455 [Thermofilum sp. ex4484_79]
MADLSKRSFSIFKRIGRKLYWCPRCNIPLIDSYCSECCGLPVLRVKVTPPADVRPAIGIDYFNILRLFRSFLGERWNKIVPKRNVILLNKIQYIDLADEIIIDGQVVASRFYNIEVKEWRLRPSYPLVYGMIQKKVGYYAIVNRSFLKRRYEVRKKHILESNLPTSKGEYVAVATKNKEMYALGVLEQGKRIRIIKPWRRRPFSWFTRNATWRDIIKGNLNRLRYLERDAIDFIREISKKYNLPKVVSFSGGKDSLVTYLLVKKALGKVDILFNDTGLELPETVNFVKEFAEKEDINLIYASAGDNFWYGVNIMGPPARDFRWCCKVAKLSPISLAVKENFPNGALNFVGQRKYESLSRALSPRVWRNRWISNIIAASPINNWIFLEVWLYLLWKKERINPLYYKGFDRLGCWLCPASQLGEFEEIKGKYPFLWKRWERLLHDFAREKGLDKKWIEYGLWRWLKLPGKVKVFLSRMGIDSSLYEAERGVQVDIIDTGEFMRVKLKKPLITFSKERMEMLTRILGNRLADKVVFDAKEEVFIISKKLDNDSISEIIKGIVRTFNCVGCGLCTVWCPVNAITIRDRVAYIDIQKCTGCKTCVNICPIAEYTFMIIREKARFQ